MAANSDAIAPLLLFFSLDISSAAPAVSALIIGLILFLLKKSLHWAKACKWLSAVLIESKELPGHPNKWWLTLWKYSPVITKFDLGNKLCISATLPACEFSIGIKDTSVSLFSVFLKTSSKDSHGTGS